MWGIRLWPKGAAEDRSRWLAASWCIRDVPDELKTSEWKAQSKKAVFLKRMSIITPS